MNDLAEAQCNGGGGEYQGDGSSCDQVECAGGINACCIWDPITGSFCLSVDDAECTANGGVFLEGQSCMTADCQSGACCLLTPFESECVDAASSEECMAMGMGYFIPGVPCPTPYCE